MKTFEIMYQAAGAATDKTVQVDVYKPDKSKDTDQSGVATEIGTTGRYYKSFDADAPGWSAQISDDGGGKAIKYIDKATWEVIGVIDAVADVQTAIGSVASAIATLQAAVTGVDTKADSILSDTTSLISAVDTLSTQLTAIESAIGDLEAPPMVG